MEEHFDATFSTPEGAGDDRVALLNPSLQQEREPHQKCSSPMNEADQSRKQRDSELYNL